MVLWLIIFEILIVFVIVFLADIFWARYIDLVAKGKKFYAANYSMLVYIFAAAAITEYVSNYWLIIPACLGAWCGTFYGTKKNGLE